MGLLDRLACGWHQSGAGRRVCRRCAPVVLAKLERATEQRDAYAGSLHSAGLKVTELDRKLTAARRLLLEAAEHMKRGRTARPLSGRIVAFLEA